ncbi:unnamed protein product, partial [Amoebophrya sp. A25]
ISTTSTSGNLGQQQVVSHFGQAQQSVTAADGERRTPGSSAIARISAVASSSHMTVRTPSSSSTTRSSQPCYYTATGELSELDLLYPFLRTLRFTSLPLFHHLQVFCLRGGTFVSPLPASACPKEALASAGKNEFLSSLCDEMDSSDAPPLQNLDRTAVALPPLHPPSRARQRSVTDREQQSSTTAVGAGAGSGSTSSKYNVESPKSLDLRILITGLEDVLGEDVEPVSFGCAKDP